MFKIKAGLSRPYFLPESRVGHVVHHANISGGAQAEQGWRRLFAEALLKWETQPRR